MALRRPAESPCTSERPLIDVNDDSAVTASWSSSTTCSRQAAADGDFNPTGRTRDPGESLSVCYARTRRMLSLQLSDGLSHIGRPLP